jgi:hypothetical protein
LLPLAAFGVYDERLQNVDDLKVVREQFGGASAKIFWK